MAPERYITIEMVRPPGADRWWWNAPVRLFDNMWLRIIALATGILLWFHVATEKSYTYRLALPLAHIVLAEGFTLAEMPADSIEVAVSATGKQLLRRKWRDEGLTIQATELSPGRHTLALTSANVSLPGSRGTITLEEIVSPTSLQFGVDYIAEVSVRVAPDLAVSADDGFVVRSISEPDPPVVALLGARSRVRMLTTVTTERRQLDGLRDNLSLRLGLLTPPGFEITVSPDSVTVTIEIVAAKTRVVDNLPIMVENAPAGTSVSTEPAAVRVELVGPPDEIDRLDVSTLAALVDYLQQDSDGFSPVSVSCPAGFRIKKSSVSAARVVER